MSEQSTYCFIVNCASNSSRAESIVKHNEGRIRELFPGAEFVYIHKTDSIKDVARLKAQTCTHIIACGGDGTVNQTAHGLIGTEAILGVLPLGTGNDFARGIGLSKDFDLNLETLYKGKISNIDVLENEWGYTLNTFGIGVDGLTNYFASRSRFKSGLLRYFFAGLRALITSKPFTVSIQTPDMEHAITGKIWMVTVANGKTEGGRYKISPTSVNNDGKAEIIVVRNISRFWLVAEFLKLSFGMPFSDKVAETYSTSSECKITTGEKIAAHADGEQVYMYNRYTFKLLESVLPVIVRA